MSVPNQPNGITFPCTFPLKVVGWNDDDFQPWVLDILTPHVPDLPEADVMTRVSGGGKYLAVTVTFTAQSREQLDLIYMELSKHKKRVLMLI